jgi:hypothetical protein
VWGGRAAFHAALANTRRLAPRWPQGKTSAARLPGRAARACTPAASRPGSARRSRAATTWTGTPASSRVAAGRWHRSCRPHPGHTGGGGQLGYQLVRVSGCNRLAPFGGEQMKGAAAPRRDGRPRSDAQQIGHGRLRHGHRWTPPGGYCRTHRSSRGWLLHRRSRADPQTSSADRDRARIAGPRLHADALYRLVPIPIAVHPLANCAV